MAGQTTVMFVTGQPGCGKTYYRCPVFILEQWLKEGPHSDERKLSDGSVSMVAVGKHYSNFPIDLDALAREAFKRFGMTREFFDRRVELIPDVELKRWEAERECVSCREACPGKAKACKCGSTQFELMGPWVYFADKDLTNCHIAIDEIHVYFGRESSDAIKRRWKTWLGELRHQGCCIEFLTQHKMKVAKEVDYHASVQMQLIKSEERRDPFFRIPLGDWYELKAAFLTGEYSPSVWVVEKRDVDGRKVAQDKHIFWFNPYYYDFYNSYSAPAAGGNAASGAIEHEYQKRGRVGLLFWFMRRNFFRVTTRVAVACFIGFLITGHGGFIIKFLQVTPKVEGSQKLVERPSVPGGRMSGLGSMPRGPSSRPSSRPSDDPEIKRLVDALASREKELVEVKDREQRSSAVVLLTPDEVGFRAGYIYKVGDKIDYGPYEGAVIDAIWWERGLVRLKDGRVLRMREDVPVAK